jgi:ABC-2 type transport system ATP-binding protein
MSAPYIVAHGLGKSFSGKPVLADVSLAVEPGDVVGVLGKNGAGKTTLLELLLGFTPATAGSAQLFGHDSYRLPGAAKARVGFVPQQDELVNQLTAADQIGVIASFYPSWDDALVLRLSREWEVDLRQRIKGMSVGQRQKQSILLSLGHKPDVLILDEPVASLDPVARRQFLEQIIEVAADGRRSVVFSSHIVSDVERLASKIWILKDQRMYWQGDFDSLKESIVRLHVRSTHALPASLAIPNALSVQRNGTTATAVVHGWHADLHDTLGPQLGAEVEIERLTLEDIFLELHRELPQELPRELPE